MQDDLLAEARRRQTEGIRFAGFIYSHQLRSPIGRCIEDLELLAKSFEPGLIWAIGSNTSRSDVLLFASFRLSK